MGNFSNVPFSPAEVTQKIIEIARMGSVGTTTHCRNERMPERGITYHDLLFILRNGEVREDAEYDEQHEEYRYKVEGNTIDDETAVAITVVVDHQRVRVVTVF